MSDSESYSSRSVSRSLPNDEVLNDHRNQPETLPPPEDADQSPLVRPVPSRVRTTLDAQRFRRGSRSHSISETQPIIIEEVPAGILLKGPRKLTRNTRTNSAQHEDSTVQKMRTNDSVFSNTDGNPIYAKRERRPSRSSIDSEADSHASRLSQETEEDVCFPMLREHVRINGIDFDEIEDFINEERENALYVKKQSQIIAQNTAMRVSTTGKATGNSFSGESKNALKYTPASLLRKGTNTLLRFRTGSSVKKSAFDEESTIGMTKEKIPSSSSDDDFYGKLPDDESSDNVRFGGTRINDGELILPERFSFFHSNNEETIHAPDIPSLVESGQTIRELFKDGDGTWWLDCTCPTDAEMKTLAKAFGIHPLTAEDIRMQETREKVELFRNYYFVCFHTFEPDKESEDYLEPINVYIVVFREGILTFHFSPILHPANVRRRVRQLRDYVDVSADWLCYALIDDITDGFAPVITAIEYEADAIEDSVLEAHLLAFSSMLRRIGESRRKVMTLMRLLSNKADVIKMFAKRCQDEAYTTQPPPPPVSSRGNVGGMSNASPPPQPTSQSGISFAPGPGAPPSVSMAQFQGTNDRVQPRADIALYLGDIQDHVVTMFQNLAAYEKIFSRSHANYLAQLQVESFNSNLRVTEILGNVTLLGTLFMPLNLVTGLFGMNVRIPGEQGGNLNWFGGILAFMFVLMVTLFVGVKLYLRRIDKKNMAAESGKKSIKSLSLKHRTREAAKSIISFPNRYE